MDINPRALPGMKLCQELGSVSIFCLLLSSEGISLDNDPSLFLLEVASLTLGWLPSCKKHLAHLSLVLLAESCPCYTRGGGDVPAAQGRNLLQLPPIS